ncbi:hypothetical protein [Kocuria marina]|uniref:hypothetical protein n=1 Tax=Kocuria marina TaxID=223184 RepID=UPI0022E0F478|nr:hypothetical protein [Kocuria marina]
MVGPTPVSRPARLIRGWAAAGVSTLCAATSHYAVDPNPPNVVLLALTLSIAGLVCVLLAGRRLGAVRTACAVALSQLPFHALFSAGGHPAGSSSHMSGTMHAHGHVHHAHVMDAQSLAPADPLAMGHDPMVWAHVGAAVLTFVLIRHAEDGWWRLVHAAARVFFTALALAVPVLVPCHALRPVPLAYLLPPRTWSPVRIISRRGPPALSL